VLPVVVSRTARLLPASVQRLLKIAIAPMRDAETIARIRSWAVPTVWEEPPCCICQGRSLALHTRSNGFSIVRCRTDGLLFVSPRPRNVAPYYDARYYTGAMPSLYADYDAYARASLADEWRNRLAHLEAVGGMGTLLDVGCATGQFLVVAQERGWSVAGVELSSWAAQQARERVGAVIYEQGVPNSSLPAGAFDAITMWDCIEHLTDPTAALDDIYRLLKPGGLLMLSTGAVPHRDPMVMSHWYYPPWHLYYFAEETIRQLLSARNFETLSIRFENEHVPQHRLMIVTARAGRVRADA
jgi:ubiquinone/menaquinone biosynthesis C-methylase UbiE